MVTRTYEVRTFGCQMNVHDSERIAGLLDEAGYAPVADGAQPDVVVFSTCAVRENADNKLDGNLGHLKPRSRTARPACHPSPASSSFADPPRDQGDLAGLGRQQDRYGFRRCDPLAPRSFACRLVRCDAVAGPEVPLTVST